MATVTAGYNWTSGETVTPAKLNSTAAPTVVVADGEVTTAKIADSNVTAAKLASNAVETAKIANDAVTDDKLSLTANAGEIKKALNADNSPPIYACRAWVNFNGATVTNVGGEDRCTIRSSGNVDKVVRGGAGSYTIHFTTAMPDANYATTAFAGNSAGNASLIQFGTTPVAASVVVSVVDSTFSGANREVSVAIFR